MTRPVRSGVGLCVGVVVDLAVRGARATCTVTWRVMTPAAWKARSVYVRVAEGSCNGKEKGELLDSRVPDGEIALEPRFASYADQAGHELPGALKSAESSYWNLCSVHGSLRIREWSGSNMVEFFNSLALFLSIRP